MGSTFNYCPYLHNYKLVNWVEKMVSSFKGSYIFWNLEIKKSKMSRMVKAWLLQYLYNLLQTGNIGSSHIPLKEVVLHDSWLSLEYKKLSFLEVENIIKILHKTALTNYRNTSPEWCNGVMVSNALSNASYFSISSRI